MVGDAWLLVSGGCLQWWVFALAFSTGAELMVMHMSRSCRFSTHSNAVEVMSVGVREMGQGGSLLVRWPCPILVKEVCAG